MQDVGAAAAVVAGGTEEEALIAITVAVVGLDRNAVAVCAIGDVERLARIRDEHHAAVTVGLDAPFLLRTGATAATV